MSHAEQLRFFELVATANASRLPDPRVLEIGSYDVNGSIRGLFPAREYVGVDLTPGPGVDLVTYGHEVDLPDASFDIAVSGECFEHDPHWSETFTNMVRMVRPGGLVAFTCASRGRPEHGTTRTRAHESPGTQSRGVDYYRNLEARDFSSLPLDDYFSEQRFWYVPSHFDLFFAGVRAGGPEHETAILPSHADVVAIASDMSVPHRLVRWPLRLMLAVLPDGERYQSLVRPYWSTMRRLQDRVRPETNAD